jgi:ubiquinone/menaquinone biosynthesis C-methylase UbiE
MDGMVNTMERESVKREYQQGHHADYHARQFTRLYRSTAHLIEFVQVHLGGSTATSYSALDVGCGAGANIYHLAQYLPHTDWVGVDWADHFFAVGQNYLKQANVNCRLVKGDFYQLTRDFGAKSFDLVFSIQTLSWLPGYEDALRELLRVARRWVFISSLFTDYRVDVISKVYPYAESSWDPPSPYFYNIYSYPRFQDVCRQQGATALYARDFVMDIDLPEPTTRTMGTFTRRLEYGERMQFSGPLHMPWRFIAIRMDRA